MPPVAGGPSARLLYSGDVHDSLYRVAGKQHTALTALSPHPVTASRLALMARERPKSLVSVEGR